MKVYQVNKGAATITLLGDVFASFVTTNFADDAALITAVNADTAVSDDCLKIRINKVVYFKSGASAYTKNVKSATFTGASVIYD